MRIRTKGGGNTGMDLDEEEGDDLYQSPNQGKSEWIKKKKKKKKTNSNHRTKGGRNKLGETKEGIERRRRRISIIEQRRRRRRSMSSRTISPNQHQCHQHQQHLTKGRGRREWYIQSRWWRRRWISIIERRGGGGRERKNEQYVLEMNWNRDLILIHPTQTNTSDIDDWNWWITCLHDFGTWYSPIIW